MFFVISYLATKTSLTMLLSDNRIQDGSFLPAFFAYERGVSAVLEQMERARGAG